MNWNPALLFPVRQALKRATAVLFLVASAANAQVAPTEVSEVVGRIKANMAAQCEHYRRTEQNEAARPFERQEARDGVEVLCNCFPSELDRQMTTPRPAGLSNQAYAESISQTALQSCGARSLRSRLPAACREDATEFPQAETREKYCSCLQTRVEKLTDREIAEDSMRARQHYEAKVAARVRGEAEPPEQTSAIENIEKACRAEAP